MLGGKYVLDFDNDGDLEQVADGLFGELFTTINLLSNGK